MLRLLFSSSSTSQFIHRIEIPIAYSGLVFRLTGTNAAAQQLALRELGRLRFSIRQQPVVDADMDYLISLADHWYGSSEFVSTLAGRFAASVFIPRSFIDDKNVERVTKSDAAIFETSFTSTLVTKLAGSPFLAELYAVVADGPQSYNLLMFQQAYPTVSANQVYIDDISTTENVCAAYISDTQNTVLGLNVAGTLSNISRVRVRKGDQVTDVSIGAALAYTAQKYRREGATDPTGPAINTVLAEILGMDASDLSTRLDDTYNLAIQTGGGAAIPQILTVGFKPNPDRLAESAGEISDRLQRGKRTKTAAGKTRALSWLDSTAGV
jgi:hypothetical protein